jgi:hypothetical protein
LGKKTREHTLISTKENNSKKMALNDLERIDKEIAELERQIALEEATGNNNDGIIEIQPSTDEIITQTTTLPLPTNNITEEESSSHVRRRSVSHVVPELNPVLENVAEVSGANNESITHVRKPSVSLPSTESTTTTTTSHSPRTSNLQQQHHHIRNPSTSSQTTSPANFLATSAAAATLISFALGSPNSTNNTTTNNDQQLTQQQQQHHHHARKPSEAFPHGGRPRAGSQTEVFLESIQYAAQQQVFTSGESRDISAILKASVLFILAMLGESLFVMVRDWLDNTKTRSSSFGSSSNPMELEQEIEALSQASVRELEIEHQSKHGKMPTDKQRLLRAKSVKQLAKAKSLHELVKGLGNTGKTTDAEKLARRTVAIRMEMYGPNHIATANALHELACTLCQKGDYVEAETSFREAIRIIQNTKGQGGGSIREITALQNLASALILQAKSISSDEIKSKSITQEANKVGKKAIELAIRKYGENDPRTKRLKKVWG